MSRFDAPSDYDYYDEPWARETRCASPDCHNIVSSLSTSVFCQACLNDLSELAGRQMQAKLERKAS